MGGGADDDDDNAVDIVVVVLLLLVFPYYLFCLPSTCSFASCFSGFGSIAYFPFFSCRIDKECMAAVTVNSNRPYQKDGVVVAVAVFCWRRRSIFGLLAWFRFDFFFMMTVIVLLAFVLAGRTKMTARSSISLSIMFHVLQSVCRPLS